VPITQEASGSQTATVGTEHTLATITTTKTFVANVDCANMQANDFVELKVWRKVRSSDTLRVAGSRIVSWLEAAVSPNIDLKIVASGGGEFRVTLRQISGTSRAFPWSIDTPG
jgi:hypothetical protein